MHGGHSSVTFGWPTATFRHTSASEAVMPPPPLVSQTHSGSQVAAPVAVRKTNKQSEALGVAPLLAGWPQSPWAADAEEAEASISQSAVASIQHDDVERARATPTF